MVRSLFLVLPLLVGAALLGPEAAFAADPPASAAVPSAKELLNGIDHNMTFDTRTVTLTMTSKNARRERTFTMKTWGRGQNESSIEYTDPPREKGTRMLRMSNELWMYVPSVEKTQKISGHMLRQGMMGSDVSYEDMMSANKLTTDYDATVLGAETIDGHDTWKVEMIARDKSITYPKRVVWIDKASHVSLRQEMYAVSGMKLKTWTASEIKEFPGGRYFPTRWTITDNLQTGTQTLLEFKDIQFGVTLPPEVFTTRWLERGN
jgi:outer membrane lipoprotein-sorting protein